MQFFNEHTNEKHFVCTIHSHLLSIVIVKQLIWVQMNQILTPHTHTIFTFLQSARFCGFDFQYTTH